jgi:hypothetical protein
MMIFRFLRLFAVRKKEKEKAVLMATSIKACT